MPIAPALALAAALLAQPPAPPTPEPAPPLPLARQDLADAYLRLDRAYAGAHLDAARTTEANKAFDALTGLFFAANFAGAIERLGSLSRSLEGLPPAAGVELVAEALKIEPEPPVCRQGLPLRLKLGLMYAVDAPPGPVDLPVTLVHAADGRVRATAHFTRFDPAETLVELTIDTEKEFMVAGRWTFSVPVGTDHARSLGSVILTPAPSLAEVRDNVLSVLSELEAREPKPDAALAAPIAAARSRAKLLNDRPVQLRSGEFLFDLNDLANQVEDETRALLDARNPYARRPGDWWREIPLRAAAMPVRIYAPPEALALAADPPAADKPLLLPLVIALHGAGADEHMFPDAYGHGIIKSLADQNRFILASPATAQASTPAGFDALVAALSADYPIDPARIYIVGHSMGAMGAARLAVDRADRLAAVACLAGGPLGGPAAGPGPRAPMLIVAAELDTIIPLARLKPAADKAIADGRGPVEFRLAQGYGHTLMVGAKLPEAIDWLLTHHR